MGKTATDRTSRSNVRAGCSSSSNVLKMTPGEHLTTLTRLSNNRNIISGFCESTTGMSRTSNGGNSFTASSDREPESERNYTLRLIRYQARNRHRINTRRRHHFPQAFLEGARAPGIEEQDEPRDVQRGGLRSVEAVGDGSEGKVRVGGRIRGVEVGVEDGDGEAC
ncbi:hypothetical protein NL676_037064 [Syzygium grande]|nr:hypothetical protein NL676_037064 [Syzygium grande]